MTRILVVDDVPDVLDCIRTMLRLFGHEAEVSESAHEALEKLATQNYDVLVTDISMPEMNGMQLLETLRCSNLPNRDIYTIALTGYSREVLGVELAKFDTYVMKTNCGALLHEIECAPFQRRRKEKAANFGVSA